jgi:hypothetical protein
MIDRIYRLWQCYDEKEGIERREKEKEEKE